VWYYRFGPAESLLDVPGLKWDEDATDPLRRQIGYGNDEDTFYLYMIQPLAELYGCMAVLKVS
jgi:hypothetical protein